MGCLVYPPQRFSGTSPVWEKISSLPATDYSNQVETEQAVIRDEGAQRASYMWSWYLIADGKKVSVWVWGHANGLGRGIQADEQTDSTDLWSIPGHQSKDLVRHEGYGNMGNIHFNVYKK